MIARIHRTHAQQAIVDAIFSGQYTHICVSAGLAFGKTHLAGDVGVSYCAQYPGTANCVSGPLFPQLMNSNYLEFIKMLERCGIRSNWDGKLNRLKLANRSSFKFQSLYVETGHLKGPEYELNMIDEADMVDREHFERQTDRTGRVRSDAQPVVVVFANSVTKAHWIAEDFVGVHGLPPKDRHLLIQGTTYDNAENLRADYIRNLEIRYPRGTIGRRRWMYGETGLPAEDAVFPEFDADHDTIDTLAMPAPEQSAAAIYVGEGNKPTVVLEAQLMPNGQLLATAEWVGHRVGHLEAIENAKGILSRGGRTTVLTSNRNEDIVKSLKRHGLRVKETEFDPRNREHVKTGIKVIRDRLAQNRLKIKRYSRTEFATPYLVQNFEAWENKTDESDDPQDTNNEAMICLMHIAILFDRPNMLKPDDDTIFGNKRIDVQRKQKGQR